MHFSYVCASSALIMFFILLLFLHIFGAEPENVEKKQKDKKHDQCRRRANADQERSLTPSQKFGMRRNAVGVQMHERGGLLIVMEIKRSKNFIKKLGQPTIKGQESISYRQRIEKKG